MHSNDLDLDAFSTMMLLLSATEEGQDEEQGEYKSSEYDFGALKGFLSTHPKSEERAAMVEEFKAGL